MVFRTKSARETEAIGRRFSRTLRRGEVITLSGPLGAGKTTFVRGVLRGFGVRGRIVSPSFLIVKSYPVRRGKIRIIHHLDGYRIKNRSELEPLGLPELLHDPRSVTLLEWPRAFRWVLSKTKVSRISLRTPSSRERRVSITRRI